MTELTLEFDAAGRIRALGQGFRWADRCYRVAVLALMTWLSAHGR